MGTIFSNTSNYYGYTREQWDRLSDEQKRAAAEANPELNVYNTPGGNVVGGIVGTDPYGAPVGSAGDWGWYDSFESYALATGNRNVTSMGNSNTPLKTGMSITADILFNLFSPLDLPLSSWLLKPNFSDYDEKTKTYTGLKFAKKLYKDQLKKPDNFDVWTDYQRFRDFYMPEDMKKLYNNGLRSATQYKRIDQGETQKDLAMMLLFAGISIFAGIATFGAAGLALALAGVIIQETTTDSVTLGLVQTALHDNNGQQFDNEARFYIDAIVESAYKRWLEDGFWVDGKITDVGETFMWLTADRTEYELWLARKKQFYATNVTGDRNKPGTLEWAIANNREDWLMGYAAKDLKDKYKVIQTDAQQVNKILNNLRAELPKQTSQEISKTITEYQAYRQLRQQAVDTVNTVAKTPLSLPWARNSQWQLDYLPSQLKMWSRAYNPQITDAMAGAWKYHHIMNAAQLRDYFFLLQRGEYEKAWNQINTIVYWSYNGTQHPEITKDVAKELGKFARQLNILPPINVVLDQIMVKTRQQDWYRALSAQDQQKEMFNQIYQTLLYMDFGQPQSNIVLQSLMNRVQQEAGNILAGNASAYQAWQEAWKAYQEEYRRTQQQSDYMAIVGVPRELENIDDALGYDGNMINPHALNTPSAYGYDSDLWTALYINSIASQNLVPQVVEMTRWKLDYDNNYYKLPTPIDYRQIESYRPPTNEPLLRPLTQQQIEEQRFGAVPVRVAYVEAPSTQTRIPVFGGSSMPSILSSSSIQPVNSTANSVSALNMSTLNSK